MKIARAIVFDVRNANEATHPHFIASAEVSGVFISLNSLMALYLSEVTNKIIFLGFTWSVTSFSCWDLFEFCFFEFGASRRKRLWALIEHLPFDWNWSLFEAGLWETKATTENIKWSIQSHFYIISFEKGTLTFMIF